MIHGHVHARVQDRVALSLKLLFHTEFGHARAPLKSKMHHLHNPYMALDTPVYLLVQNTQFHKLTHGHVHSRVLDHVALDFKIPI